MMIWLWMSLAWATCTVRTADLDRTTWSASVSNGWSLVEKGGERTEATLEGQRIIELRGPGRQVTLGTVRDDGTVRLAAGILFPWVAGPFGGPEVRVRQGIGRATYEVDDCSVAEAMIGVTHLVMRVRRGVAGDWGP